MIRYGLLKPARGFPRDLRTFTGTLRPLHRPQIRLDQVVRTAVSGLGKRVNSGAGAALSGAADPSARD